MPLQTPAPAKTATNTEPIKKSSPTHALDDPNQLFVTDEGNATTHSHSVYSRPKMHVQ